MRFRPCIDLRNGKVVQIVGGTLDDSDSKSVATNFEAEQPSEYFANRYKQDALPGGHVIALGPGNADAAMRALKEYPGGMQYGGGVNLENAVSYLDSGASHVIVTSFVFRDGRIDDQRLKALVKKVGKERLVLDLSCRKKDGSYWVVTDRWQTFSNTVVDEASLADLAAHCDEFLVHGVDVEGHMAGIEEELVSLLGRHSSIPATYAGGAKSIEDLERVKSLGSEKIDLTIGSALDIFGGTTAYLDVVSWQKRQDC